VDLEVGNINGAPRTTHLVVMGVLFLARQWLLQSVVPDRRVRSTPPPSWDPSVPKSTAKLSYAAKYVAKISRAHLFNVGAFGIVGRRHHIIRVSYSGR